MATTETPKAVQSIRKLRHWKQSFSRDASFVFRRATAWPEVTKDGKRKPGKKRVQYPAGAIIPPEVARSMGAKLRRWWEAGLIECHQFEAPNVTTGMVKMRDPTGKQGIGPRPKSAGKAKKKAGKKKAAAESNGNGRPKFEPQPEHAELVLDLVAEGATQKAIADAVGCSTSTLKRYFDDQLKGIAPPEPDVDDQADDEEV